MKTYFLTIGLALLLFACNNTTTQSSNFCVDSGCCKTCDDVECQQTCKKISEMTEIELKSAEGIKLKETCAMLCEKNKCCSDTEGKVCSKHEEKACCKHE